MSRSAAVLFGVLLASGIAGSIGRAQETRGDEVGTPDSVTDRTTTTDGEREWSRLRADWDPATDRMSTLASMAAAATALNDLPRFHALLDSLVQSGVAGPNALRYWGATGLQLGVSPDTVVGRFGAALGADSDAVTVGELVQVLQAYEARGAALDLLDRAEFTDLPRSRLGLVRGQLLAGTGDRQGAVDAWLAAFAAGGDDALVAAERIGDLLGDGQGVPRGTIGRIESAREVAGGREAEAAARLLVRLHATEGRWSDALDAAGDSAFGPVARGEALRGIAATARAAGRLEPAADALSALVELGPPASRPEDRLALGEIQGALGDEEGAAESFETARQAGVTGARARELAANLEAARASGDADHIARVVEESARAGIDPTLLAVPRGDLFLARARVDSALGAYATGIGEGPVAASGLEALGRVRLAQALLRSGSGPATLSEIGSALLAAPADPAAWRRLESLAGRAGSGDSLGIARSLLEGLAGEWRGRSGEPAAASAALERAAGHASAGEAPALLLAAGRWAMAAGEPERARRLWRAVVEEHGSTPYALDARRSLSEQGS